MDTRSGDGFFSPRNLSFLVMIVAIGVVLFSRPEAPVQQKGKYEQLAIRQIDFTFRVAIAQTVIAMTSAGRESAAAGVDPLLESLKVFAALPLKERIEIERYILLDYLRFAALEMPVLHSSPSAPLHADFIALYRDHKEPTSSSPLYSLPVAPLVRIKLHRLHHEEHEAERLERELFRDSSQLVMRLFLFSSLVFVLIIGGIVILSRFIRTAPEKQFSRVIGTFSSETKRLLYETAVLYLFLLFPVAMFLSGLLPFGKSMFFHAVYIPVAFGASIAYFILHVGSPLPFFRLLVDGKIDLLKEIAFGFIGFVAIFPLALLALFFSFGFFGMEEGIRFAHPIVFEIENHPLIAFFLAAVLAPVTEEVIFRAFLYGHFRTLFSVFRAAALTGMIFAVLHPQGWLAFLYLTVVGGGLAILREYRNGIVAPIVTHMMINSLALFALRMTYFA